MLIMCNFIIWSFSRFLVPNIICQKKHEMTYFDAMSQKYVITKWCSIYSFNFAKMMYKMMYRMVQQMIFLLFRNVCCT